MIEYSIIIPAYNEEARLGATLTEIADYLAASGKGAEVIVVDDGSTDATVLLARDWLERLPLRIIETSRNMGKGHAVRTGMLAAQGAKRLFADADGSTPIAELDALDAVLDGHGGGVALASIALPDSVVLSAQSKLRSLAGRAGNRLIQLLVLPGIRDSQRGFKLFTAEAAVAAFSTAEVDGWAFDVEVLALARQAGFSLHEVPVTWEHRLASRVRASSYLTSLWEVWKIRRRIGRTPVRPGAAVATARD